MNFKDKNRKTVNCKMSCIPVKLCEFPAKELTLVAVYGFRTEPMLLPSNLKTQEKSAIIIYYDGILRSGAFAYLNHKEELP